MRRIIIATFGVALLLAGCKVGNQSPSGTEPEAAQEQKAAAEPQNTVKEDSSATENLEIKEDMNIEPKYRIATTKGDIVIKLYEQTPLHKQNFMKLAQSGFYEGICFHRVINGFMIQVGDPLTKDPEMESHWGEGGPGYTIPAEIVEGLTHKKGAIAAARRGNSVNPAKESSGSQFYIVQDENGCKHLDGEYTIFGEVVSGFEVIDRIASVATDFKDKPTNPIEITSVTPVN